MVIYDHMIMENVKHADWKHMKPNSNTIHVGY